MRTKGIAITLAAAAALLVAVGIALAQEGDPGRGATLFANNCAVCHGADGRGRIGANLTQDFPAINVDAFLRQTITTGVAGSKMPAWGQANGGPLSDQDIADVAAYVQQLSGGSAPPAPAPTIAPVTIVAPPNVSGDASLGAQVFAMNCAVCHGDRGQGRVGATLAKQWPAVEPARYVQQTVENGIEGSVMPAWLDSNGGPLSQTDINNVTAYVLSLAPAGGAAGAPAPGGGLTLTTSLIGLAALVLVAVVVLVLYYRRAR
jgi:cytochrome c oxidase cbb3-type subunit 3